MGGNAHGLCTQMASRVSDPILRIGPGTWQDLGHPAHRSFDSNDRPRPDKATIAQHLIYNHSGA